MCKTCSKRESHVLLEGESIAALKENDVFEILKKCTRTPPLHVVKPINKDFFFVHFKNEAQAADFYLLYAVQKRVICCSLKAVTVRPSMFNGKIVKYRFAGIKSPLKESLCSCSSVQPAPKEKAPQEKEQPEKKEQPKKKEQLKRKEQPKNDLEASCDALTKKEQIKEIDASILISQQIIEASEFKLMSLQLKESALQVQIKTFMLETEMHRLELNALVAKRRKLN